MNLTDNKLVIYCPTPAVKRAAQLVAMDYGYKWSGQTLDGERAGHPLYSDSGNPYVILRREAYGRFFQVEGNRHSPTGLTPVETLNELVQWLSHGTP